ncbi:MAG: NAD(P)/FAD-dependent oxidoreductase [Erysipelotrichia bacterium]|nr:NAD(P)/FAD-dependent oxidoreductase [Erysipelotrichia bacterium]
MKTQYDILIIGAGVIGTLIARELSRYDLNVVIVDKSNDAGNATSSANSAIIHSGYDPEPGSNKAKFNLAGNHMFPLLAKQLNVTFKQFGSLTLAFDDEQVATLTQLAERAKQNCVPVQILNRDEVLKMEPAINQTVKAALYAPTAGVINPFNFVIHAMENAIDNGVTFLRNHEVLKIEKNVDGYLITTNCGPLFANIVINAAGVHADVVAAMATKIDWKITPRKGEYYLLDHDTPHLTKHTLFPLPSSKGKGVLITPMPSGNYLIGPSSEFTNSEDLSTDAKTLQKVKDDAQQLVPSIPFTQTIRVFSGLRASSTRGDFIVEYSESDQHFINVAGIDSPGFAAAPAIARYVVEELVRPLIELNDKINFNPYVQKYLRLPKLDGETRNKLIKTNPEYGLMICNCEKISLGEIKDLFKRSCPPHSIKGIKRRVRAGFGRCQGAFCQPKIVLLLAEHYGLKPEEVLLDDEGSYIIDHMVKEKR